MQTSTTTSVQRSGPKGSYAGSMMMVAEISFDPTAASAATGVILPAGAIVLDVYSDGGATGGTNPTVDVGTSGDDDAYASALDADGKIAASGVVNILGVSAMVELTVDTEVYAGVGASAATGGTVLAKIVYFLNDPTNGANG